MTRIMSEQGDLFGREHAYVSRNARATSSEAALVAFARSGTTRRLVYDCIARRPATIEEIAEETHLSENTVRPRRKELEEGGFIEDSGLRRLTRHRNASIVWRVR